MKRVETVYISVQCVDAMNYPVHYFADFNSTEPFSPPVNDACSINGRRFVCQSCAQLQLARRILNPKLDMTFSGPPSPSVFAALRCDLVIVNPTQIFDLGISGDYS